jgi:hypothetical protein
LISNCFQKYRTSIALYFIYFITNPTYKNFRCGVFGDNAKAFRTSGAVSKIVKYLYIEDTPLQEATVRALYQLSRDPANCAIIHKHGGVKVGDMPTRKIMEIVY